MQHEHVLAWIWDRSPGNGGCVRDQPLCADRKGVGMRRFLKHMWDWLINCPLFQRDYHLWVSRVGSGLFECLICHKTRFEPDEVRDMAALEVDQQPNPEILREYLEGDINWDPIVTHLAQTPPDRVSYAVDPRLLDDTDTEDFAMSRGGTD